MVLAMLHDLFGYSQNEQVMGGEGHSSKSDRAITGELSDWRGLMKSMMKQPR